MMIQPFQKSAATKSRQTGFTIAEMLIVTIVIGILAAIGGRTYFNERDRFEFNNAFTTMTGIIQTARNSAITGTPVYSAVQKKTIIPPSGYGIYINLSPTGDDPNFTLFASLGDEDGDTDTPNRRFDKGVIGGADTEKDLVLETYRLPRQVTAQYFVFNNPVHESAATKNTENIKWSNASSPPGPTETEAVIFFRPPLADTYLGDNGSQSLEDLAIRFFNPSAAASSPKKCQYLRISRLKTFPNLEYSDCSEFTVQP